MNLIRSSCYFLLLLTNLVVAQSNLEPATISDRLAQAQTLEHLREETSGRLDVVTNNIAPEEIDRAVLNKLMEEIASRPAVAKRRLNVSDSQLQDIFIIISNARSFINGDEMAAVRSMCRAWQNSVLDGEEKVAVALNAYERRKQFTKNFIAKYYAVVLSDIEASLTKPAKISFTAYMLDRRKRMANVGVTSFGSMIQSIPNGNDSIDFLCRG
jgi:hypothetical protein